ncbi:peptide-methionine (S)-S-oxide reductase MsrA [Rubrimonas cliftonensis]|uniref:Peptide methionine sulfoxide reductase MsrA n=1 Tax=Rubrimonas cliftonensis TaxID=89524 RepID=A0A1H3WNW3_9RHOB|nr:peptide-methionine (S)-S-oxide reductase MsrA [Rubrimonas cliftonensis]SDZ88835.1 peptide-methionine (S)-S-oxide reductase [Rubrimonas cliftonensis]
MIRLFAAALMLLAARGALAQDAALEAAIFAGGCFWCVEADFDKVSGVVETVSGYTGGWVENPTYQEVTYGGTGHSEAVRIRFDPARVSYPRLLEIYFRTIDPFDDRGQFCDRGPSYAPAIFVGGPEQRAAAEAARAAAAEALDDEIETPIRDAATFWPAEDHHQNYHETNAAKYGFYRASCGRDRRIRRIWGETPADALRRLG